MVIFRIMLAVFFCFLLGCNNSQQKTEEALIRDANTGVPNLEQEQWLFNTQYIKTIDDSSWEKVILSALNNYKDFKIDFTFISTGKPQTCGLYAKGIMIHSMIQEKDTQNKKKFLLRPNLIPETTIIFIKDKNSQKSNTITIEISNIAAFIESCGVAHQYANGEYGVVQ
ncbi:hypothetical protein CQA53_02775 [Helicobacter didelphidarum]|uniref:Lipoprotein n=1 Tax=Helicobacter didelphidarum TaxID=2040648 RepID=A0A3D8INC4_9HELI|nr:hypothetical protein CQA53_02775 [Helicobacter didelphidarum]